MLCYVLCDIMIQKITAKKKKTFKQHKTTLWYIMLYFMIFNNKKT